MKSLLAALFALFAGLLVFGYALFSKSASPQLAAEPEPARTTRELSPLILEEARQEERSEVQEFREPLIHSRVPSVRKRYRRTSFRAYPPRRSCAPELSLVKDLTGLEAMFAREHAERIIDASVSRLSSKEEIEPGSTILFPGGCFLVGNLLERNLGGKAPADFTIAGAGMDATLLVLHRAFGSRSPLLRFEVRDCTVFTNGHNFFDHRQGAATVVLDRVRVIGFDNGASCALAFDDGLLLRARACRFEGGYGRTPKSGNLFDIIGNDALVARFEGCTVSRTSLELYYLGPKVTVLFSGCLMEDLLDRTDQQEVADRHEGIELVDTLVTTYNEQVSGPLERDLNDLFPDWKERLVQ